MKITIKKTNNSFSRAKRNLAFCIFLLFHVSVLYSQTSINNTLSKSSSDLDNYMNYPAPGLYFMNTLDVINKQNASDSIESSGSSGLKRLQMFWDVRLSQRIMNTDPFLEYHQAILSSAHVGTGCGGSQYRGKWQNTGPRVVYTQAQGIVEDIWVNPSDAQDIWIGVSCGGLWHTTDGGQNWLCVSDQFITHGSIGIRCIAVNPFDHDEMWVATFTSELEDRNQITWKYALGLWHTTDGGLQWSLDTSHPDYTPYSEIIDIRYAPYKVAGQSMLMAITDHNGTQLMQKMGANNWQNVTPANQDMDTVSYDQIEFTDSTHSTIFLASSNGEAKYANLLQITHNNTGGLINSSLVLDGSDSLDNLIFEYDTTACSKIRTAYVSGDSIFFIATTNRLNSNGYFINTHKHHLYSYNMASGLITNLNIYGHSISGSRYTMELEASNKNPDIMYYGGTQPGKFYKENGVWKFIKLTSKYHTTNFHPDVRAIFIHDMTLDSNNSGLLDTVFWGNDGGLTLQTNNIMENKNGSENFYTSQGYDLDIYPNQNLMAQAQMHNNFLARLAHNQWVQRGSGDGVSVIYDQRFLSDTASLLYNSWSGYGWYIHNKDTIKSGTKITLPIDPDATNGYKTNPYPHDFDDTSFYFANHNAFQSQPMGYAQWIQLTDDKAFKYLNGKSKLTHRCKAFEVSKEDPRYMYFSQYANQQADTSGAGKICAFVVRDFDPIISVWFWKDKSPYVVINNRKMLVGSDAFLLTDIESDPKDHNRVWISLGGIEWNSHGLNRVLFSADFGDTWQDVSAGLTQLPVTQLRYQEGSDDILYAATDAGVYYWNKPTQCWVKMNGHADSTYNNGKMPNVFVSDMEIDYCRGKLVAATWGRGIWESDLINSNNLPNLNSDGMPNTLSTNTTWTTSKMINTNIRIKTGATLTIKDGAVIGMPREGHIIVEPGAKLIVNNATITNHCGEYWSGINLLGDKNDLSQNPNLQGTLIMLNGATLENARNAITQNYPDTWGWSGGIIHCTDAIFRNNRRSCELLQFHKYDYWNNLVPSSVFFKNCTFIRDDNYIAANDPTDSIAPEITIWEQDGVTIQGCTFKNDISSGNYNSGKSEAIFTIDGTVRLGGYCGPVTPSNCNQWQHNQVEGYLHGVHQHHSTGSLLGTVIDRTDFRRNSTAVKLDNCDNFIMRTSTAEIGQGAGCLSQNCTKNVGLHVRGYNDIMQVEENTFTDVPHLGGVTETYGTIYDNTGYTDRSIYRCQFEGLTVANLALQENGKAGKFGVITNNIGLDYICNNFESNQIHDILVAEDASIKYNQGQQNYSAGNTFLTGDIKSIENASAPNISYYYEGANSIPTFYTGFKLYTADQSPNCESHLSNGEHNPAELVSLKSLYYTNKSIAEQIKYNLLQLIDGGNTQAIIDDIIHQYGNTAWDLRCELMAESPYLSQEVIRETIDNDALPNSLLMEVLIANKGLLRDEGLMEFVSTNSNLSIYHLQQLETISHGSDARITLEHSIERLNAELVRNIGDVLFEMQEDTSSIKLDSIIDWKKKIPNLESQYELCYQMLPYGLYTQAQNYLSSLSQHQLYDQERDQPAHAEHIAFLDFIVSAFEAGRTTYNLTPADSSSLEQYKQSSTIAVSKIAKAMLDIHKRNRVYDCVQIPASSGKKEASTTYDIESINSKIKIYPNPTKKYITIDFSALDDVELQLELLDLTGHVLLKKSLNTEMKFYNLDLSDYNPNAYILKITKNGETLTSEKIIKL